MEDNGKRCSLSDNIDFVITNLTDIEEIIHTRRLSNLDISRANVKIEYIKNILTEIKEGIIK